MAAHGADHGGVELGAGTVDYADHQRTYLGVLKLLKYCTAAIVVVLLLMAFFLL